MADKIEGRPNERGRDAAIVEAARDLRHKEAVAERSERPVRRTKEGMVKKGGTNPPPTTPRPAPPAPEPPAKIPAS